MTDRLEMPIEQFAEAVAKENARLTECLKAANENHEHFEREWYLAKDRIEKLEALLRMIIDWDNTLEFEDGPSWGEVMEAANKELERK